MNENVNPKDFRVDGSEPFVLVDRPNTVEPFYEDKSDYKRQMKGSRKRLNELQEKMYAHDQYGMLCVFQAMDAAGKDGTIREVMRGVNPHGVSVHSFKQPSKEELDHDFLWRSQDHLPRRGHVSIFNRSYYEEILVVKVHPEIAKEYQQLPEESFENLWEGRYASIREHEAHLARNGTKILKFFLNLSRDEQRDRFVARIDEPEKNWKFSTGDVRERQFWDQYQEAYEKTIQETARPNAPWFVIPADDKKNMRIIVSNIIRQELESMPISFPQVSAENLAELQNYRAMLLAEDSLA